MSSPSPTAQSSSCPDQPQQVSRNDQTLIDGLAIVAEPRPDIHRVAEISELALGVAAFADDDSSGVQPGAKGRRNAELGLIVGSEAGDLGLDRKEARDAARVAGGLVGNGPADDHLVADIGVHSSLKVADRFIDVEEEPGDQVVDLHFAHRLREARRMGEIKEHDDQPLTGRTMIGPEQNAREQFAADQPPGLDHHADDHGARRSPSRQFAAE